MLRQSQPMLLAEVTAKQRLNQSAETASLRLESSATTEIKFQETDAHILLARMKDALKLLIQMYARQLAAIGQLAAANVLLT